MERLSEAEVPTSKPRFDRGEAEEVSVRREPSLWQKVASDSQCLTGLIIVASVGMTAMFAPWLIPYSPYDSGAEILSAPSWTHPLGTDSLGRDQMARIVHGSRNSLMVVLFGAALSLLLGLIVGVIAGYRGGRIDTVLMRTMDAVMSIPAILLAIVTVTVWGSGVWILVFILGITYAPQFARVVRAATLEVRNLEYIQAAVIGGASTRSIMMRHVLPNIFSTVIVQTTITMSLMLLIETVLSFLGMGVQPPNPSWGWMVAEGRQWMELAPWVILVPGLMISYTIVGFVFLGDGLKRILGAHNL